MATSSSLKRSVSEIVTCRICLEDFKDPRSLPCVHSFCLRCLQRYCEEKCIGDDVPCPLCRKKFQIPQDGLEALPHNFFLQNLVEAKTINENDKPGTSCSEHCSEEEQSEPAVCGIYCDVHRERRLELYCYDCRENICELCCIVSHKHHKCNEIEKVAKDFIASIQSDIKAFPSRISQLREEVKQVELVNEKFLENVKKMELEVERKGDEMKRLVDDHVTKLMQELDEVKASSVKEAKARVENHELALVALESFHAYSSGLVSKGSACDITRAANDLHDRADELLKTCVSSGEYHLPDVAFVPTSVETVTATKDNVVGSLLRSHVIHTFPATEDVRGVTLLNNELYVLRERDNDQVDVYSTTDFTLLYRLSVSGLSSRMRDITSCAQTQCIYIADSGNACVHRVGLDRLVFKWPVNGKPQGLSVTRSGNLLVTCCYVDNPQGKLVELGLHSKGGKILREVTLHSDIKCPWHSVQLVSDQYVVCHFSCSDVTSSEVSLVGSDGKIIRSENENAGLHFPSYIAVADEFIFVADESNNRITVFDPALKRLCYVLESMKHGPTRLCLDNATRHLYVGQDQGIVSVVHLYSDLL